VNLNNCKNIESFSEPDNQMTVRLFFLTA